MSGAGRPEAWNAARQTLEPFADLTNDGDEEGALFIDRLPLLDEPEAHPGRLTLTTRACRGPGLPPERVIRSLSSSGFQFLGSLMIRRTIDAAVRKSKITAGCYGKRLLPSALQRRCRRTQ